jgi:hypothetical protein
MDEREFQGAIAMARYWVKRGPNPLGGRALDLARELYTISRALIHATKGDSMPDETSSGTETEAGEPTEAEKLADEDPNGDIVAEEEEVTLEEAPKLDNAAIIAEAEARVERMKENGRSEEDIAHTYAGKVADLAANGEDAMSAALWALAQQHTNSETVKKGPYNRRRLAVQVAAGSYNRQP